MFLPPKSNNFMKFKNKNTKKLPLWLILVFGIFNIVFGMNFGFVQILPSNVRRTVNIISKFISLYVLFLLFLSIILGEKSNLLSKFCFTLFSLNYFFCFLTIDFCKYTVFDFLIDARYLRNFKIRNEDRIPIIFIFIFILYSTGMKCYICVITCNHDKWSCLIALIPYCFNFFIAVGSFSVLPFIHILINYYIYLQMLHLRKSVLMRHLNDKTASQFYVEIMDCFDKIKPLYNLTMVTRLSTETPFFFHSLWVTMYCFKNNLDYKLTFLALGAILHDSFSLFIPSVIFQMANLEVEALKLILYKRMILNDVEDTELKSFLQYIQTRELNFMVFGFIPVDIRLPLALSSFCATYLVVLVQFTHLLD